MIDCDVVVIGAGPAGAIAALNLAAFYKVVLVENTVTPVRRVGESLVPAAKRLLRDMGLWDDFARQLHLAALGNRSWWGSNKPEEVDFLRDPDGHGWHLDRAEFEMLLRNRAASRGVEILAGWHLEAVLPEGEKRSHSNLVEEKILAIKRVDTNKGDQPLGEKCFIKTRFVIDASGRKAIFARQMGAQRKGFDRLVCGWVYGKTRTEPPETAGFSLIASEENGWWYSAPLPDKKRILAFHTDSNLPTAKNAQKPEILMKRAKDINGISEMLRLTDFQVEPEQGGYCAAHSASLSTCFGQNWIAVGDAAMCFDPLSSRGLFNALYTGLLGAEATYRYLQGETKALSEYGDEIAKVVRLYRRHLSYWYSAEKRWADAPFWACRSSSQVSSLSIGMPA